MGEEKCFPIGLEHILGCLFHPIPGIPEPENIQVILVVIGMLGPGEG